MVSDPRKSAFAQREQAWRAFHEWEESQPTDFLSLEARIRWYGEARRIAESLNPASDRFLNEKISYIQEIRSKLALLKRTGSNVRS